LRAYCFIPLPILFALIVLLASAGNSYSGPQKSEVVGALIVKQDAKGIQNVFYRLERRETNLTRFTKRQEIYQYAIAPSGRLAFVWHMEKSPRVLSLYDLRTLSLKKDILLGFGGSVRWNLADELVHVYGCGSGCQGAKVLSTEGKAILSIIGSPIEVSPSGRYLAIYTIAWTGKQDFELYDVMNEACTGPAGKPLIVINGVGTVTGIQWSDEKRITVAYEDAHISGEGNIYLQRKVGIDLSAYSHRR
jgi:hypothetical protein